MAGGHHTRMQDHGRHAALAVGLHGVIEDAIASVPSIPGMMLRVESRRLGLSWEGAAGLADRSTQRPLAGSDALRVASVTKTFTAAAVLRLVEQSRLALGTSIAHELPAAYLAVLSGGGYQPARITVQDLLYHVSGLFDYAGTLAFDVAVRTAPGHRWTRLEQVQFAVAHGHPHGAPGAAYHYSDTGYVLLGAIVERVTGLPLAAAYRALLGFDRLGLRHTYLETLEPEPADEPIRVHQYYKGLDLSRVDASFDLYGGGGLVSTLADLARFYRALFGGRVFARPATLHTMLAIPPTNEDDDVEGDGYAMGIYKVTADHAACWGHDGAWGIFAFHCPSLDLNMMVSSNQGDVELNEYLLLGRIVRLVHAAVR